MQILFKYKSPRYRTNPDGASVSLVSCYAEEVMFSIGQAPSCKFEPARIDDYKDNMVKID